ncbi:hypothetical protein CYMTET_45691, partial [Cymbomonas tetramitiformis]
MLSGTRSLLQHERHLLSENCNECVCCATEGFLDWAIKYEPDGCECELKIETYGIVALCVVGYVVLQSCFLSCYCCHRMLANRELRRNRRHANFRTAFDADHFEHITMEQKPAENKSGRTKEDPSSPEDATKKTTLPLAKAPSDLKGTRPTNYNIWLEALPALDQEYVQKHRADAERELQANMKWPGGLRGWQVVPTGAVPFGLSMELRYSQELQKMIEGESVHLAKQADSMFGDTPRGSLASAETTPPRIS